MKRSLLYLTLLCVLPGLTACSGQPPQTREQVTAALLPSPAEAQEQIRSLNLRIYQQYSYEEANRIFAEVMGKAPHFPRREQQQAFASIEEQFAHWVGQYPQEYQAYIEALSNYLEE